MYIIQFQEINVCKLKILKESNEGTVNKSNRIQNSSCYNLSICLSVVSANLRNGSSGLNAFFSYVLS